MAFSATPPLQRLFAADVTLYGTGWQKEACAIDAIDDNFAICDTKFYLSDCNWLSF
jgi:hypothetical protein